MEELLHELETLQDFSHMLRARGLTEALGNLERVIEENEIDAIKGSLASVDMAAQKVRHATLSYATLAAHHLAARCALPPCLLEETQIKTRTRTLTTPARLFLPNSQVRSYIVASSEEAEADGSPDSGPTPHEKGSRSLGGTPRQVQREEGWNANHRIEASVAPQYNSVAASVAPQYSSLAA